MSRIHEALKKAEEERASAPNAELLPPVEREVAVAGSTRLEPSVNAASEVATERRTAVPSTEHVRFDELLARCAHPQWHMDPNVNIFSNPELSPHGAEQFRTLRSRLYQLRSTQALRTVLITSSVPKGICA
jgi:hypothetical protein